MATAHRPFVPQGKQECLCHLERTPADIGLNAFVARLLRGEGKEQRLPWGFAGD
jgi:hypothetical protein